MLGDEEGAFVEPVYTTKKARISKWKILAIGLIDNVKVIRCFAIREKY